MMGETKVYTYPEKIFGIFTYFIKMCMFALIIINVRESVKKIEENEKNC